MSIPEGDKDRGQGSRSPRTSLASRRPDTAAMLKKTAGTLLLLVTLGVASCQALQTEAPSLPWSVEAEG